MTEEAEIQRVAVRLLADREHSRAELKRKLHGRGHDPEAIEAALDTLAAQDLLSDARMAEAYVAERLSKGFGPLRIRQELRQRGVAEALIEARLERPESQWMQQLVAVATRKFGPGQTRDRKEQARRARFLEQRGFPAAWIGRFLHDDLPD